MSTYIDLHNHILPGIDDGPKDINESVKLARELNARGFETVVATPHALGGKPAPEKILTTLNRLQEALVEEEIPLTLLPGSEQHITPDLLEKLDKKESLTLNNTSYLLLELPMLQPLPLFAEELIFNLNKSGYRPVIPHPERVVALQMNEHMLFRLHQLGALYQVTWGAFTGLLGSAAQKTARFMLDSSLVHLLATDAHHPDTSLLKIDKAALVLDQSMGQSYSKTMLTERPKKLIAGDFLDLPAPTYPESRAPRRVPFLSRLFRA